MNYQMHLKLEIMVLYVLTFFRIILSNVFIMYALILNVPYMTFGTSRLLSPHLYVPSVSRSLRATQ